MISYTKEDIQKLTQFTPKFLCDRAVNTHEIQFIAFKIRDVTSNTCLFQMRKPQQMIGKGKQNNQNRTVKYIFGPNFFNYTTLGVTFQFRIGSKPVTNFSILQRHYFRQKLMRKFEFDIPMCMPNTTNSFQAIYQVPFIMQQIKAQMIKCPYETVSDSFYFVQNNLIMHNKAYYSFA